MAAVLLIQGSQCSSATHFALMIKGKKKKSFHCEYVPDSVQVSEKRGGKGEGRRQKGRLRTRGGGFFPRGQGWSGFEDLSVDATAVIFPGMLPCWFDCQMPFPHFGSVCQGWSKGLGIGLRFSSPWSKHISCLHFSYCETTTTTTTTGKKAHFCL